MSRPVGGSHLNPRCRPEPGESYLGPLGCLTVRGYWAWLKQSTAHLEITYAAGGKWGDGRPPEEMLPCGILGVHVISLPFAQASCV